MKDITGKKFKEGDIIKWYFDEFLGYSATPSFGKYTEMIDIVKRIDGKWYSMTEYGDGAFLYVVAKFSTIIGNITDNRDLLTDWTDADIERIMGL
jgi:hypothetical protein